VEVGQKVHQGEAILVLEAMKMQNEITAPLPGTVTDILVETSQSVNAGDVLLVIEPEAGG
jgi:glutaconyl-CoA/methylmalonyl-CoA decarboxylase subunit gamma